MIAVSRVSLAVLLFVTILLGALCFWFFQVHPLSTTDDQLIAIVFQTVDLATHSELPGVNVELNGHSETSASNGDAQFVIRPGAYTAAFTKPGCVNVTKSFDLIDNRRITVALAKAPPSTGTYTLSFLTSDGQYSMPEFRVRADGVFYSQGQKGRYDRSTLTVEAVAPAGWKFNRWGYVAGYYVSDRNLNPITIEVKNDGLFEALFQPTGTLPTISVSRAGLPTDEIYTITGSGFTAYGTVYINARDLSGRECGEEMVYADSSGEFMGNFTMKCAEGAIFRALDDMTGLTSSDVNLTIAIAVPHILANVGDSEASKAWRGLRVVTNVVSWIRQGLN